LPNLIQAQKAEAEELWNRLHVVAESRPRFEGGGLADEFRFYESEVVRLKKLQVALHPTLTVIAEREEIVNEYEAVVQSTSNGTRLLSRERGSAQQLMKEEKARRRYKKVLPRIEKKLIALLKDHKAANGTDFEWDGRPYIEQLTESKPADKGQTLQPSPRKCVHNENVQQPKAMSFRGRRVNPT